jgi:XisI protein
MDKVTQYKQIAQKILDDVLEMMQNMDNTEVFEVNEIEKGHFLIMTDGWDTLSVLMVRLFILR